MSARLFGLLLCSISLAQAKWITAWTGSAQGPFPVGNITMQPSLTMVFAAPEAGARDQTFRMIVKPDIWGPRMRLRFSNAFGTKPVKFNGVFAGLQLSGAAVMKGTNRAVLFAGNPAVIIRPGESAWSDAVTLNFASSAENSAAGSRLEGRKLAVSFHVTGDNGPESGPMTWHAGAQTTSFLTARGAGAKGNDESETWFPYSTTSWYFLDALDMTASEDARLIVAFGDSITDGTATTLNGDDRWPDVLSRRLHAAAGNRIAIVNAGIAGNRVAWPTEYSARNAVPGGPSAGQRLERDVLSLSGVAGVIWLEGINDFSADRRETVETVEKDMREVVARIRARIPGVTIVGATLTSAKGYVNPGPEMDGKRKTLNEFIRTSKLFDGVADFDKATLDPKTGELRPEFVPDSAGGGPGDKLHPNRAGHEAMGMAVDPELLLGKARKTAPSSKR